MWTLQDLLGDIPEEENIKKLSSKDLGIKPKKTTQWKRLENPGRLTRILKIENEEKFNGFILECLKLQFELNHYGRMTIQYPEIKFDIWTKGLNDVTELDLEVCQEIDHNFEDWQ